MPQHPANKIENVRRRDRFEEGLEILTDTSRSDADAVRAYEKKTRGLKDANAAFGLCVGLNLRAILQDHQQDIRAVLRWADDGGPA